MLWLCVFIFAAWSALNLFHTYWNIERYRVLRAWESELGELSEVLRQHSARHREIEAGLEAYAKILKQEAA